MTINKGKQFENRFREDWVKSFPKSFILRLQDQVSGYKYTSRNPCDFICYANRTLFLIECKSHSGNTFPLTNFTQYVIMKSYSNIDNIIAGIVLWMYDHDVVVFIPIEEITKMKQADLKSFNIKMLNTNDYNIIKIPSKKLRTFMESDYSILLKGEDNESN